MKIEFENHIPDYCDPRGCKREHLYFDSLDELLEAKKEWLIDENHKDLIFACGSCGSYNTLMVSSQSEEWWWVIGYVKGIDLSKYLPRFDEVYIKPKMSKELEALEAFENIVVDLSPHLREANKEEIKIIETALKRLERIDKQDSVIGPIEEVPTDTISKKFKALDIIKEKLYSWSKLYINTDEQRVSNVLTIYDIDNKEKKLLKEVLL